MGYPILLLNFLGSLISHAVREKGERQEETEKEGKREREKEGERERRNEQSMVGFGPVWIWRGHLATP